jgi:hypothetical protein
MPPLSITNSKSQGFQFFLSTSSINFRAIKYSVDSNVLTNFPLKSSSSLLKVEIFYSDSAVLDRLRFESISILIYMLPTSSCLDRELPVHMDYICIPPRFSFQMCALLIFCHSLCSKYLVNTHY